MQDESYGDPCPECGAPDGAVIRCDEAAIARVAAVLDDGRVCPGDESAITPDELRALAVAALRAAGEAS